MQLMFSLRLSPLVICCRLESFGLLWFGGAFTVKLVGSPPFWLVKSSQVLQVFISYKGTSKTKQQPQSNNINKTKQLKNKRGKEKKKRGGGGGEPCINDSNFTERNNRQVILISKALLGGIMLVIEIGCKINRLTFRGIPGFY